MTKLAIIYSATGHGTTMAQHLARRVVETAGRLAAS